MDKGKVTSWLSIQPSQPKGPAETPPTNSSSCGPDGDDDDIEILYETLRPESAEKLTSVAFGQSSVPADADEVATEVYSSSSSRASSAGEIDGGVQESIAQQDTASEAIADEGDNTPGSTPISSAGRRRRLPLSFLQDDDASTTPSSHSPFHSSHDVAPSPKQLCPSRQEVKAAVAEVLADMASSDEGPLQRLIDGMAKRALLKAARTLDLEAGSVTSDQQPGTSTTSSGSMAVHDVFTAVTDEAEARLLSEYVPNDDAPFTQLDAEDLYSFLDEQPEIAEREGGETGKDGGGSGD